MMTVMMGAFTRVENPDAILLPFLQEQDEARSQQLLSELIREHIEPVIKQVIGHNLRQSAIHGKSHHLYQEEQDLCSEAILRLLTRLQAIKQDSSGNGIVDLRAYAAVVARHTCQEHLRQRRLEYKRLKDHIRYVIKLQPGFALWRDGERKWLCGFDVWRSQKQRAVSDWAVEQAQAVLRDSDYMTVHARKVSDLLALVFDKLGGPVEFSLLVRLIAGLRGLREDAEPFDQFTEEIEQGRTSQSTPPDSRVEQRLYLRQLWKEIGQLPLPHRTALLLNLKDADDRGLIVLLADLKIATIRQIAEALELAPKEFAALWNDLPWDDARIALHLKTTRQTVINLRKSARRFLAQRMNAAGEK